jgi:TonB family protein
LCIGKTRPRQVIRQIEPSPPRKGNEIVGLSTVIGVDGKPHEIKVVRSVDKDYDSAAVEALRQWEFKPASCDGEPKEVKIGVEIEFRFR